MIKYKTHLNLPARVRPEDHRTLSMPAIRRAKERPVNLQLRLGKLSLVFVICLSLNIFFIGSSPHFWLNWYLTLIWTAYLPLTVIGLLGAIFSQKQQVTPFVGFRQERVIFLIPTIARKDTLPGLCRVIDSILLCASNHLPNFAIHILVEEDAAGVEEIKRQYRLHDRVLCIIVPKEYTPTHGTRYKARANQYAMEYRRRVGLNGSDVFVYHGDDDTSIGHDTVWSIAQFIENNQYDLAQGLLTYPHQLTRSWFCRLADSIRPSDDMTRFCYCTGKLGSPLAGLHGEHVLMRASIEDQIGWDFGPTVTVEDAYFGLKFAERYGGRSTFLPSCSYGASPASVRDLIRQRRRWASGLVSLLFDSQISWKVKPVLYYSIANWTIGIFQHVVVVLSVAWLFHTTDTSPILPLFIACWCANFAFQVWMYLEGLRINLEASQASRARFWLLPFVQVLAIPLLSLVEAWSALLGLTDFLRKKRGFDVISKGL